MKKLLSIIWYSIYHQTKEYAVKEAHSPALIYREYYLYRVDKILFISYMKLIDTASTISIKKRNNWYYRYMNIRNI